MPDRTFGDGALSHQGGSETGARVTPSCRRWSATGTRASATVLPTLRQWRVPKFFGVESDEIRGRLVSALLGAELDELACAGIERALAGDSRVVDGTIIDPTDGRYTQMSCIPYIADGKVRGLLT
jgi:hypothetical protein